MNLTRNLNSLFNPEIFQGWGKKHSYFEGWYFKILNQSETVALAVIPGIAIDNRGNSHSFIQVLDGKRKSSRYHKFAFSSFNPEHKRFLISIDNNHFSEDSISLDLPGLTGNLYFSGNIPWPKPWHSPGIMGPFSFVPFMECYHGIVSMDHSINGIIKLDGQEVDFNDGRGYIEKDWGTSFPDAYIWLQSNHFNEPGVSLKLSVAIIPWLKGTFTGFIAGIWLDCKLIRFTTYNSSVLKRVSADKTSVSIVMENKKYLLQVDVERDSSTSLASPVSGFMGGRIEESMSSAVDMRLTDKKNGNQVFSGRGRNAALEVAGNVEKLFI